MTHYIPAFAPITIMGERAVCGSFVFSHLHSLEPSCEKCKRLIAEDDTQRKAVSVAEVVERY